MQTVTKIDPLPAIRLGSFASAEMSLGSIALAPHTFTPIDSGWVELASSAHADDTWAVGALMTPVPSKERLFRRLLRAFNWPSFH